MSKATRIHIPTRTRKPNKAMDPYFDVKIMKYLREDGVDDGQRAIVNSLTNKTMGNVSKGYNLVTHREASTMVTDFLTQTNVPFTTSGGLVGTAGARYFETVGFPNFAFTPDGKSTAFDIIAKEGHDRMPDETMIPYIQVKNSYDRTSRVSWSYGVARLICSNGMAIMSKEDSMLSFKHNQKIDMMAVRDKLFEHIEKNINIVQIAYNRLNGEKGLEYLRELIDGNYPDKFKVAVLNKVTPYATIASETIDEDGHKILKVTGIDTDSSAWAIYNVATDVASHDLLSPIDRDVIGRRIAKQFMVA